MTSSRRVTSGQSCGRDIDGQSSAQAVPPAETHSDRKEERSSRLLGVTAGDDAFAPAGTLGAAHNLRANWSAGGAIPLYSRSSNAERSASLYGPGVSHGEDQRWPRKFLVVISSRTVPKSAVGKQTIAVTCKVATLVELPEYKLSPRDNQSTEQALPLRQMFIKSAIPAWTFLLFTELIPLRLRIMRFIVAG
jgi:hypothetical protein